jgi:signal transduction histidine kinase
MVVAGKNNQLPQMARIFNALGNLYIEANDSSSALKMYQKSYDIGRQVNDNTLMGLAIGNMSQFRASPGEVSSGLDEAIRLLKTGQGNEEEIAQFLVNSGLAEQDPSQALKKYGQALEAARRGQLVISQLGALNNMVYSLLETGKPDSAETCLVKYAIPLATHIGSHDWLATLYDTYSDVLISRGEYKKAAENLKQSLGEQILSDHQQAGVQVRLLAAMLDTKNRELAFDKNTKDLELNKRIVKIQWLTGLALLFLASIIVMFVILRGQRRKLLMKNREIALTKKIIRLEEHQTAMLGRELHDVVSSMMQRLSGFMKNLEQESITPPSPIQHPVSSIQYPDSISTRLNELLSAIRGISHRMNKLDFSKHTLGELLNELKFDIINLTGLNLTMEIPAQMPPVSENLSLNVYRIVQELLTNAGKYAGDSLVSISLGQAGNRLVIAYQDRGPGFDPQLVDNDGMGLSGIRDRVEFFNGVANLETSPGNGVSWIISIPLTSNQKAESCMTNR